ncbi:lipopolysaccharide biosynthesis protein [Cohnella sp.]|uniref:lipopolysaccharide biosynthesis protein n=1 Tax=Cohnella sp. TaxID=1883426 RepID=UPI003562992F
MDNSEELREKMLNAAKWSTITEIAAKIISPITNMVLARLMVPEAFGVVATVIMIISFAEMFTDAGFQKYLVQNEFKNSEEKYQNANVAFWTNLGIALFLWGLIALFCEPIATFVGNPGLGMVLIIACVQLPLSSFSSIQMALYRRDFDFKTLFLVRIVSVFIPFVISIPLAFLGFSYWSLIIGTICIQLSNTIILTVKSKWKPKLNYSVAKLKVMLSFSIWSLIEAISIWLTTWVDALIIGSILSTYYLGLYKTSITMVNLITAIITAATVPVLFSALSRLQNNSEQFNNMFYKTQRAVSILVFPIGVGLYLYSDLATQILLGSQWSEASGVIGQWALTSAIMIVFGQYCSEVYRAKGRPKLSFLAQVLHLIVLVPVCIYSANHGFWMLVFARSWIRIQFVLVHFLIMKFSIGIPISNVIRNTFPTAISAIAMGFAGYFLQQIYDGIVWSLVSIATCAIFYFGLLYLFPGIRKEIVSMIGQLKKIR